MGAMEKWALVAVVVAIAFYAFGLNALYLCGVAALLYLIARPSKTSHR